MAIIHQVVVEHRKVSMVAKEYRVTSSAVKMVVAKACKKPEYVPQLFCKQDAQQENAALIEQVIEGLIARDTFIDSCDQVLKLVQ